MDHVHFENQNLRAGWANVHAYVNGQVLIALHPAIPRV